MLFLSPSTMFFEWFSHWDWDRSHWRLGRIGPKTELIYVGLYPCNCFEGTGQKTIELLPMISKRTSFRPTFTHGYGGGVSWPHFCELSHQYFPAAPAASESLRSTEGRAVFRTPPPRPPPFRWKKTTPWSCHRAMVSAAGRGSPASSLHLGWDAGKEAAATLIMSSIRSQATDPGRMSERRWKKSLGARAGKGPISPFLGKEQGPRAGYRWWRINANRIMYQRNIVEWSWRKCRKGLYPWAPGPA